MFLDLYVWHPVATVFFLIIVYLKKDFLDETKKTNRYRQLWGKDHFTYNCLGKSVQRVLKLQQQCL
jgi:hypothetical protein